MKPIKLNLRPKCSTYYLHHLSNSSSPIPVLDNLAHFVFQSVCKYGEDKYRNKSMSESIREIMGSNE